nr:unnamed protein product [Digitaria exilis]
MPAKRLPAVRRSATRIRRSPSKIARSGNAATACCEIPPLLQKGSTRQPPKKQAAAEGLIAEQDFLTTPPFFHRNPSPRMRQPATVAVKPQRRQSSTGISSRWLELPVFIPQQRHQERNPERELSPRRGEGFNFKPEEPSSYQKMTRRMYAHPWEKGLRGASEENTSNRSNSN